jgi:LAO/AO transport system kinase
VVSKCDRPDANRTVADLKTMLTLGLTRMDTEGKAGSDSTFQNGTPGATAPQKVLSAPDLSWRPPVITTSALRDEGVAQLLAAIDKHREALESSGAIDARRASIAERRLLAAGEAILREQFARHRDGRLAGLLEQLRMRTLSPHAAARLLLRELNIGGDA